MDPLLVQLLGIMGGALAGTLAVLAKTGAETRRYAKSVARIASESLRPKRHAKPFNPRTPQHRQTNNLRRTRPSPAPRQPKASPQSSSSPVVVSITSPESPPAISTCPSCGLEAPHELMAEHFAGSPSHTTGARSEKPQTPLPPEEPTSVVKTDETRRALRNLIQMLVPPRAFGHRHSHKTENPVSTIVQQLDHHAETPQLFSPHPEALRVSPEIVAHDRARDPASS